MNTERASQRPVTGAAVTPSVGGEALRTVVRGHAFAARPRGAAMAQTGHPLHLVREDENPSDPWAVAVWHDDGHHLWRVGYLDRAVAARIGPRIDRGMTVEAVFDGWVAEPGGRWQRPLITIARHALVAGAGPGGAYKPPTSLDAPGSLGPLAPSRSGWSPLIGEAYRDGEPGEHFAELAAERPPRLWGRPPGTTRRPARSRHTP